MKRERFGLLVLVLGTAMFGAAMAGRHAVNPWIANTAAALAVIAGSAAVLRSRLRELLAVRARAVVIAVGLGGAMVAMTHLSFRLAVNLWPGLEREVAALYRDIDNPSPGVALTIMLIGLAVVAEELLWRGVAVELCRPRLSKATTGMVAVALYSLPQLLGGAWVLIAAAVGVGTIFTLQRLVSDSLIGPLISHAIWSVAIFGLLPLG